jgi:hypothetical protein
LTQTHRPNAGFEEYDPSADHSITYRSPASADSTGNIRHIWDHHISSYVIIPFLDFLGIADIISSKKTCEKENVQTHTHVQPPRPMSSGSTTPQVTDVLSGLLQKFPRLRIHHGPLPPPWPCSSKTGSLHGENDEKIYGLEMMRNRLLFPKSSNKHLLGFTVQLWFKPTIHWFKETIFGLSVQL